MKVFEWMHSYREKKRLESGKIFVNSFALVFLWTDRKEYTYHLPSNGARR